MPALEEAGLGFERVPVDRPWAMARGAAARSRRQPAVPIFTVVRTGEPRRPSGWGAGECLRLPHAVGLQDHSKLSKTVTRRKGVSRVRIPPPPLSL